MKNTQAFTLLELIVTIAIVAIMMTIAVPSFNNMIDNSRLTSNTNLLVGAFNYARSEAVNLGLSVRVESVADGGWQVVDQNNVVLKIFDPSDKNITISPDPLPTVIFQASGYKSGGGTDKITLCDSRSVCKTIIISAAGGVSV